MSVCYGDGISGFSYYLHQSEELSVSQGLDKDPYVFPCCAWNHFFQRIIGPVTHFDREMISSWVGKGCGGLGVSKKVPWKCCAAAALGGTGLHSYRLQNPIVRGRWIGHPRHLWKARQIN